MTNRTEKQARDLAAVGLALLERRGFRAGASEVGASDTELSMADVLALFDVMKAHETQAAMLAALPADKLQAARDAVAVAIGNDAYDCTRVWSAWGVGTMDQDDFVPITHDAERVEEITLAALQAIEPEPFQGRVKPWMDACFGERISSDRQERNHRFLEEALELVQACGATQAEAYQLVDYVYGRPTGSPVQEVGGVMVTLAALCLAHGMDMHAAAELELTRIWGKVEQIRAKQAAKPEFGPLPGCYPERPAPEDGEPCPECGSRDCNGECMGDGLMGG